MPNGVLPANSYLDRQTPGQIAVESRILSTWLGSETTANRPDFGCRFEFGSIYVVRAAVSDRIDQVYETVRTVGT
jgi:hypothetical protein